MLIKSCGQLKRVVFIFCVWALIPAHVCAPGGEKKAWDSLTLGLQVVVSCCVGIGNQTLALRKCSWRS